MKDFKKLLVWERAHELALKLYRITASFPKEEVYGLTSQIRRSASSAPTHIAEGCGRNTDGDLYRFLCIATGSASEFEYQLLLSYDLKYIDEESYCVLEKKLIELKKMLNAFIQKLR